MFRDRDRHIRIGSVTMIEQTPFEILSKTASRLSSQPLSWSRNWSGCLITQIAVSAVGQTFVMAMGHPTEVLERYPAAAELVRRLGYILQREEGIPPHIDDSHCDDLRTAIKQVMYFNDRVAVNPYDVIKLLHYAEAEIRPRRFTHYDDDHLRDLLSFSPGAVGEKGEYPPLRIKKPDPEEKIEMLATVDIDGEFGEMLAEMSAETKEPVAA